jgi:hypothetical protein
MAPRSGLVLLPDSSGVRDRVTAALLGSDVSLWPAAQLAAASYVLVDLTAPGGDAELRSLDHRSGSQAVVVLVDQGVLRRRSAASLPADSLLALGQLEAELGWRLQKAQERHALETQSRAQQRNLDMLLELTARYAESTDVDALLHDVTRRLAAMLDIARASLLLDDGAGSAVVVAASDAPDIKNLRIEMDRYPEVRQCLRTGHPTVVEDVPSHRLLEGCTSGSSRPACAPSPRSPERPGKVLGVLLVRGSGARPAFTPAEVDFLATVAHATAVALQNARLLESVRGESQREKSARLVAEQKAAELERYQASSPTSRRASPSSRQGAGAAPEPRRCGDARRRRGKPRGPPRGGPDRCARRGGAHRPALRGRPGRGPARRGRAGPHPGRSAPHPLGERGAPA